MHREDAEQLLDPRVDMAVPRSELAWERIVLAWVRTVLTLTEARTWWLAVALLTPCVEASAQITEFFPEVDVYSGLTSNTQFWFQSKETREDSAPDQAETGFEAFQAAIRSGRLSTEPAKGAGLEFLM